jgi:hydrogenase maturation protease
VILVIGFGNPLRQDDSVGWAVAEALADQPGVELRRVHQLLPELAELLSRATDVVFVDARRGVPPGEVRRTRLKPASSAWSGTHSLSPEALLGLCLRHYGRTPEAVLVSIGGARFGFGEDLSPVVRAAIPEAVRCALGERLEASDPAPSRTPCLAAAGQGRPGPR